MKMQEQINEDELFDEMSLLIKSIFEYKKDVQYLTNEDIAQLLKEDSTDRFEKHEGVIGYPSPPLYKHIANFFTHFLISGHCPAGDYPKYDMLEEGIYHDERIERFTSLREEVTGCLTLWNWWNDDEKKYKIKDFFQRMGKRGLLDMSGVRKTTGTHDVFPPNRQVLIDAFQKQNTAKSPLTVGARALAKHCHRDMTSSWWGDCTGTEANKNRHGLEVVNRILDGATWINIHELPGQLPILEVRLHEGYGARWSTDGTMFRGFLEPMMAEGWAVGYRH